MGVSGLLPLEGMNELKKRESAKVQMRSGGLYFIFPHYLNPRDVHPCHASSGGGGATTCNGTPRLRRHS